MLGCCLTHHAASLFAVLDSGVVVVIGGVVVIPVDIVNDCVVVDDFNCVEVLRAVLTTGGACVVALFDALVVEYCLVVMCDETRRVVIWGLHISQQSRVIYGARLLQSPTALAYLRT